MNARESLTLIGKLTGERFNFMTVDLVDSPRPLLRIQCMVSFTTEQTDWFKKLYQDPGTQSCMDWFYEYSTDFKTLIIRIL